MNRKALGKAFLDVVANQLRDGDPPETRQTYDRLLAAGIPETEVRKYLACVVMDEMMLVMREEKPFDRGRFVANLHRLPHLPVGWDDR